MAGETGSRRRRPAWGRWFAAGCLLASAPLLAQDSTSQRVAGRHTPNVSVDLEGVDPAALAHTVGQMLALHALPDGDLAVAVTAGPLPGWIRVISAVRSTSGERRPHTSLLPPGSWNAVAPVAAGALAAPLSSSPVASAPGDPLPAEAPPLAASSAGAGVQALSTAVDGIIMVVGGKVVRRGPGFATVPATAAALARPIALPAPAVVRDIRGLLDGRVAIVDAAGGVWVGDHQVADPADRLRPMAGVAPSGPTPHLLIGADGTVAAVTADHVAFLLPGAAQLQLPVGALQSGAAELDRSGNLWVLDGAEHRLRVLAPVASGVREVHSVTPQLPAAELAAVQTLAVTADGGTLLGSRNAIIRLDPLGRVQWRMGRLPTRPRRRLPAAFVLRASLGDPQAFYLHDLTTGRAHLFSHTPADRPVQDTPLLAHAAATAANRYEALLLPQLALELFALARRELEAARADDPLDAGAAELFAVVDSAQRALRRQLDGTIAARLAIEEIRYHPALETWYAERGARPPVRLREIGAAGLDAGERLGVGFGGTSSARLVVTEPSRLDRRLAVAPAPPRRAATTALPRHGQATIVLESAAADEQLPARRVARAAAEFRPWFELPASSSAGDTRLSALAWLVRPDAVVLDQRWHASASPLTLLAALTAGADVHAASGDDGLRLRSVDQTLTTRSGTQLDWVAALAAVSVRLGLQARVWWDGEPVLVAFGEPGWLAEVGATGVLPATGRQARSLTADAPPAAVIAIAPVTDHSPGANRLATWMLEGARRVTAALSGGDRSWRLLPLGAATGRGATLARPRPLVPLHPLLPANAGSPAPG